MLYLFRLITNLRFYAGLVCMGILLFIGTSTQVFSFRWLPSLSVSTTMKQSDKTFLATQKIADNAVLLAYANITVGHESSSFSFAGAGDLDGDTKAKALMLIKYLQTIRTTNVLTIENSSSTSDGLSTLIGQGQTLLLQSQSLQNALQDIIDSHQSEANACASTKSSADDLYNKGLMNYDPASVDTATSTAQEASSCAASHTVVVRSHEGILKTLQSETDKTQNFITLISENKSLLAQYPSLLQGDIPSQLVKLKKDLESL